MSSPLPHVYAPGFETTAVLRRRLALFRPFSDCFAGMALLSAPCPPTEGALLNEYRIEISCILALRQNIMRALCRGQAELLWREGHN